MFCALELAAARDGRPAKLCVSALHMLRVERKNNGNSWFIARLSAAANYCFAGVNAHTMACSRARNRSTISPTTLSQSESSPRQTGIWAKYKDSPLPLPPPGWTMGRVQRPPVANPAVGRLVLGHRGARRQSGRSTLGLGPPGSFTILGSSTALQRYSAAVASGTTSTATVLELILWLRQPLLCKTSRSHP